MASDNTESVKIALFKGKSIRRKLHQGEWWFSVVDVCEVLSGTDRPRKYWNDLKKNLVAEGHNELSEKIGQLKLEAEDGKMYLTDCAATETVFRIVQSIPSPKAEPFKRWLARVGYEREAGGDIAGGARVQLEKRLGRSVVSRKNYLQPSPQRKRVA